MVADPRHKPAPSDHPLGPFEVCRSQSLEEVRAVMRDRFGFGFEPLGAQDDGTDAAISCLDLPGMSVHYAHYGADVEVTTPVRRDNYMVLMPIAGQVVSFATRTPEPCTARCSVVSSPGLAGRTRSNSRARRINLSIRRELLVRHLVDLVGEGAYDDLVFERAIDYTTGFGRSLRSLAFWAVREASRNAEWLSDPHTARAFQDWIAIGLLRFQHHTYSERLVHDHGFVAPRDVKRVAEYILANAERPIGLAEMVAIAGVPARTLRKHFRDVYGLPPTAYLRKVRFEQVRAALLHAAPHVTVTDIAWRRGFRHMGRFAGDYLRLFGEKPSETRRRAQGR